MPADVRDRAQARRSTAGAVPLQRHPYTIFSDNHLPTFFCAAFGVVLTVWIRHNGIDNLTDGAFRPLRA
jgi:hypothetical protein